MSERYEALVSGASGLVGSEVAARLVTAGRPVTAVLHRTSRLMRNDGTPVTQVVPVTGDIRRPGFGLDEQTEAELAGRVGVVVHTAATTAFDATAGEYEDLNVRGTAHAIDLALRWNVPLVHVSTAYVCGLRDGTVTESDLAAGQSFGNGYEESKFRAERMVRETAGLRWAIVRPGIVTGATGTGTIRDYKNLYTVVKLMVEGKLRSLPGRYDATVSLAPVDHVADVVADVAAAVAGDIESACGKTFHAVGRDTLSLREISDVLAEYPSFHVATFVPETSFAVDDLEPVEREYYLRIGALYTSYFARRIRFDTANTDALLGRPSPDSGKEYLRTLLDYCLESGYLGSPLPSIEEILADEVTGGRR
ncbi:SDR family oxidoreductase [Nocardia sp. BMG51109]|uniref:SDR family oxidoreductase n=1 Tax=Nocardia sp. BMG51109 TaxID=1056816 RepID=UPI0004636C66|nr:SDR family oxidoreductase [Nocardia sp. BMG51109]